MRRHKRIAIVAGTVLALTGVGVAFASWTSTGSGSGSATAATAKTLTVTAGEATGLYPTGTVTIPVTVSNPNPYRVALDGIAFTGATTAAAGCTAATVTAADESYNDVYVAAGGSVTEDLTVAMSNDAEDACQSAAFTLGFAATAHSS